MGIPSGETDDGKRRGKRRHAHWQETIAGRTHGPTSGSPLDHDIPDNPSCSGQTVLRLPGFNSARTPPAFLRMRTDLAPSIGSLTGAQQCFLGPPESTWTTTQLSFCRIEIKHEGPSDPTGPSTDKPARGPSAPIVAVGGAATGSTCTGVSGYSRSCGPSRNHHFILRRFCRREYSRRSSGFTGRHDRRRQPMAGRGRSARILASLFLLGGGNIGWVAPHQRGRLFTAPTENQRITLR